MCLSSYINCCHQQLHRYQVETHEVGFRLTPVSAVTDQALTQQTQAKICDLSKIKEG